MLNADGERFLPWMTDPVINYEHLHRYLAVRELAAGRRVLDMASGEGYGSRLLNGVAASVIGIDIAPDAVRHANHIRTDSGPRFVQGSITALPFATGSFDLVVCFEALEHVLEQDALAAEAARVLAPGGLFVVSTPNRVEYSEAVHYRNPFHVKELDLGEFTTLLERHFKWNRIYGQRVSPVSALFPLDAPATDAKEYLVARESGDTVFRSVLPSRRKPRYYFGVAARDGVPNDCQSLDSYLIDASDQLFEVQRRAEGAVSALKKQVLSLERRIGVWLGVERRLQRVARLMGPGRARRLFTRLAGRHPSPSSITAIDDGRSATGSRVPLGHSWDGDGFTTKHFSPFVLDPHFDRLHETMMEHWSMGRPELAADIRWRAWILTSLARAAANLPGAFAEFGVYRAGFAFMILSTVPRLRHGYHLFDTFEGIPASNLTTAEEADGWSSRYSETSVEDVSAFLASWRDDLRFVKGDVFDTLGAYETGPLAFCHMDLNVAGATRVALEYAYSRLLPGAPIVFDDYGWYGYEDQRRVIDEFFAGKTEPVIALPTGQAFVVKR